MSEGLLIATGISKSFAGVQALKGVSFDPRGGEVHALMGENGAGKSTLIKIMTGAETADAGTLAVSGRVVLHMDPITSRALGIAAIYQQPALFPDLSVSENIALALEGRGPWRRVNWTTRRRNAVRLLDRVGATIHPDRLARTLSMPEQQIVEIAKAIGADATILILDEPTASLADREVERLFAAVAALRAQGRGIIYISHRLEEVLAIADRISILRDGETIATRTTSDVERTELIRLMVGRDLAPVSHKRRTELGNVALELRDVSNQVAGLRNITLSVRSGEILGIAGLVGSGRTELAETIFGLQPADSGEVRLRGARVRIGSPARAIQLGIGYVPEDRRQHGVVLEMSVAANTSLANLKAVCRPGWRQGLIDDGMEQALSRRFVDRLRIKASSGDTEVGALSGGNQQKVALARWLSIEPVVLMLDEPTQGVDIGSKAEIYEIMQALAERGVAIIMISSELREILAMSDRIAVMHEGTIAGTLDREAATQQKVMALALGQDGTGRAA